MSFDRSHDRTKTIGASEAAAVLGLSPWKSPLAVWMDKTGRAPAHVDTKYTRLGNALEPVVAELYRERMGFELTDPARTYVHASYPVSGTPDRLVEADGVTRVLEIKTAWSSRSASAWGEEGTDEIPAHYAMQGRVYLALLGFAQCDFALFSNGDLRIYHLASDHAEQDRILAELAAWWDRYVKTDTPPPVTSPQDLDALKARWSSSSGVMLKASPAIDDLAARYATATATLAAAEAEADTLKAMLQEAIADADGIEGDRFRATWKFAKPSSRTAWEDVAREMGATRDLIEKHTKPGTASRRFLFKEMS